MSESRHTREPLSAVGPDDGGCWDVRCPDTPDGHRVFAACFCTEAHARLFAASPDLLEAARDMLGAFEAIAEDIGTDTRGPCPADDIDLCGERICSTSGCVVWRAQLARAAIAAAEGRAP